MKRLPVVPLALLLLALVAVSFVMRQPAFRAQMTALTGEEGLGAQLRGMTNVLIDQTRPLLQLAPNEVRHVHALPPHGVNTFLQGEVEPAKRERSLQMIREAGFSWIRQQFAWSDLEIHAKADFEDRRNPPARSAWDKYDNIVALSEKHGLQIIARLDAPPKWAHEGYADFGDFGPPAKFENYADFVGAVVTRYKGRIKYFQLWNEPNIYPEWGDQAVNPEDYSKMLCMATQRARSIDPNVVIIAAALAPTVDQSSVPPGGLDDLFFLQRMYSAGAAPCFDVLSAQGYGLWSGPSDTRRDPRNTNVARHMLMRDVMVRNGDARKPIWLSEVNWNPVPAAQPDGKPIADRERFGVVTVDEQARFVPALYERARTDWPWVGVVSVWYFKRPSDDERNQSWYYFRMVEPDFTPTPLYEALKIYLRK